MSRAAYEEPTILMMHAQTSVFIRQPDGKKEEKIVSLGNPKTRTIVDHECSKYGYLAKAEYFDCEMDIRRTNTVGRAIGAFMPYNKNPKTPWTMLTMGLRQVRAFFFYFPRAEKCGVYAKWSQSRTNPVREIAIDISGSRESKGERLFLRGGETKVKINLKAIGDKTRAYRLTLLNSQTPGGVKSQTKVKFDRASVNSLGIPPYTVCVIYKTAYPPFSQEMFDVDMNEQLKMTGDLLVQYGAVKSCSSGEGEIQANFEYSTTQEARENLKNKWYYKDCMEKKNSEAWKLRSGLPIGQTCYMTAVDASNARKYKYDIKFNKLTDRAKRIISQVRSFASTYFMPHTDGEDTTGDEVIKNFSTFLFHFLTITLFVKFRLVHS